MSRAEPPWRRGAAANRRPASIAMSKSLPGHHLFGVEHPFADVPESFMQPAPPLLAPAEPLAPTAPVLPLVALALPFVPLLAPVPEPLAEALLPPPVAEAPVPAVPLEAPEPLVEPAAANAALDSAIGKVNALYLTMLRVIGDFPGLPFVTARQLIRRANGSAHPPD
jgi:hypothetical protein